MFQRTKICTGLLIAFGSVGVFAQDATQQIQRVEITGSSIKRIDAETSVPVTVIKADELKKAGVTSVEQALQSISAVQTSATTSQVVGSGSAGASFADARGIGQNKTLVLLNGRRLANNAIDGSAPDLNMIPFAAIERVEVLRDGASSLYGTDAIGGVINFITRRDYHGGVITLGVDAPQHAGGATHSANVGFGFGDLDKDGFNVFGFADFQHQAHIGGTQRPFNRRIIGGLSPTTSPANYYQTGDAVNQLAPDCNAPNITKDPTGITTDCYETTSSFVDYTPDDRRISGFLKGTFKINESHTFSLEGFLSNNVERAQIAPVPYGGLYMNRLRPDGTPNPFYPNDPSLDPTYMPTGTTVDGNSGLPLQPGVIHVKWRDLANGTRQDIGNNTQDRIVASLEGVIGGWDYDAAFSINDNFIKDNIAGYSNGQIIGAGVLNGVINPFGDQTAAGTALINSAGDAGTLFTAHGNVQELDGHMSRELADWFHAGRGASLALGLDARQEKFKEIGNPPFDIEVQASTGFDPNTDNEGKRNVYAGFFELNVPIIKSLDVTIAGRYDKYSDFGKTFNPKASFVFKPVPEFLLRGSFSTGFRAPSLYELHNAPTYTNTANPEDNPLTCPGGVPTAGHPTSSNCAQQFQVLNGGTLSLRPEKAKNATLGLVLEPIKNLDLEADLWNIQIQHQIGVFQAPDVFDASKLAIFGPGGSIPIIHPNPEGELSTDGSQCTASYPTISPDCGYVDLRTRNLGNRQTNGIDLSAKYGLAAGSLGKFNFGVQSTWVHKYELQTLSGGQYYDNLGKFIPQSNQVVFRWQHNAEVNWQRGDWTIGAAGHYKSSYSDLYDNTDADGNDIGVHKVSAYTTFDFYASFVPAKGFGLTVGVKNAFDRDPPFSNQDTTFQAGYDPRYTDPTGRAYYVRGTYTF